MRTCLGAALLFLCACGPSLAELTNSDLETRTERTSPLSASAAIYFRNDWTIQTSAALSVGGEVGLQYDARRVHQCLGDQNGLPQWSTTAHYRINNGAVHDLTVAGLFPGGAKPAIIPLTEAGTLEVWFETTNRWGCQEWDSNYGANYRFEIFTPTVLHFTTDGLISIDGDLKTARAFAIDYPLERLPKCRATYSGLPAWEILSYARFDEVVLKQTTVTRMNGSARTASWGVYEIPEGSRSVDIWFLSSDRAGCIEWDSDYGRNFHFELE